MPIPISVPAAIANLPTPTKFTLRINSFAKTAALPPDFAADLIAASIKSKAINVPVEIVSIRTIVRFLNGKVAFQSTRDISSNDLISFDFISLHNLLIK